jgi:uncharacterized protein HemX
MMTSCFVYRRLAQTDSAYDVDVFFDSTTIDETALTSAKDALEQSGVAVEYVEEVDPVAELKTIPGVDVSNVARFEAEADEAADAAKDYEAAAAAVPPPSTLEIEIKSPAGSNTKRSPFAVGFAVAAVLAHVLLAA